MGCVRKSASLTAVLLIVFSKILVIPKHFVPPIVVNTALGTVLWATYSESTSALSSYDGLNAHPITIAALSGAVAGGAQAIVAAPAENLRLAVERSTTGGDWSHAWREMLRGTARNQPIRVESLHEAKQVRGWMMDVRDMAGRGWKGWGWGLAKDVCGEQRGLPIFPPRTDIERLCFGKGFLCSLRFLKSLAAWLRN